MGGGKGVALISRTSSGTARGKRTKSTSLRWRGTLSFAGVEEKRSELEDSLF